ncbi:Plasmid stabilization system protein ParE [Salegentibacter echinorum]|uniref:Plasmid stabilization system protein ParE n=2 Tax=Salegentibacter echinorum TaxID=1073325 RepID=A0A1M5DPC8_SALEC|nr:Plasmid stabilization system protein ParE [Salegentibacter echinorum]
MKKNMDYSIKIYPSARTDLNNAINYYKNKQFGLEKRFLSDFEKLLNRIQSNPYIFRLENKYRNALLDIFPYLVIFEINDQEIIILAVFNTHQNPNKKP